MDTVQKVEQVKHLPIKFGEVARYVIVPGDPNRVPLIAESLDNPIHQGQIGRATSELQSHSHLVCRLLLEKKKKKRMKNK